MICRSRFSEMFRPENTFSAMMWDEHNRWVNQANGRHTFSIFQTLMIHKRILCIRHHSFVDPCRDSNVHSRSRLVLANTHLHVLPYRSETSGMGNVQHKSRVVSALVNGLFEMMVTVDHDGMVTSPKTASIPPCCFLGHLI